MIEVIQTNICERLYLQKEGTNEIFVNNCQVLKQHQINGLRFLYTQFKKKKQGVIVNFPMHTGKSVTVVLFVQAVINLLKKPVLILCKTDNEMYIWKEYLLRWTDFSDDDIEVESIKVLKGKKIFIKKADDLLSYQHHSWSIVIVKDDLIDKEMCQISDAEYKIWITSTDMKKDLTMLAFIYAWLYPKLVFNVKDFIPSEEKSKEILLKSIYLDTFLEDFVIRENNVKQFDKTKKSIASSCISNENGDDRLKKARKNKDATGTKIKRSRRIINEEETIINGIESTTTNETFVVKSHEPNENNVKNIFINNINNNKSTICEPSDRHRQYLDQNFSPDITNNTETDMEIYLVPMNFKDAVNEIVKNENMQTENSTESIHSEDIGNKTNLNLGNDKESVNVENNYMEQGVLHHSIDITQSEPNVDKIEDKCKEIIESVEKVSDRDKTNEETFHNNIDTKLAELEERTMKKFKGSFLDSIF
ncbi:unnamed protein product [Euphydryas editha]|uniref:Helicase/UvrB N-terminal domain-containing protein n=1 Tax=Euphydryas editha TaxID=104508 RepID=A0AAU9V5D9_EUPED|nr:unnamed protein product [Euphydryas editha]